MPNMSNVTLVQNFNLPGEICRKFAVDWSAENKISICTAKAVYILTSHISPLENDFPSPIHKQVIRAPEESLFLQPIGLHVSAYKGVKTFDEEAILHSTLMDHTLNPKPAERAESFCAFRCAKWSPKGTTKYGRCILAALTMDHRLILYEEKHNEWILICDLTQELLKRDHTRKTVKKNSKAENKLENSNPRKKRKMSENKMEKRRTTKKDDECDEHQCNKEEDAKERDIHIDFKTMKDETYRIAPMEITWSGMFGSPAPSMNENSSEYCFLIVAMKSGHVQFWKISSHESRNISLVHEWDTGLGLLTTICWQQTSPTAGFLMCGSLRGILAFIPITVQVESDEELSIVVKDMCKVWDEEDLLAVDHIAVLKAALKRYIIVAAKQHALVGCEIVLTDATIIIRNVGHSFGLHNLPLTAMCVLDSTMPQNRLLIATMEGLIVEIKVLLKEDEIKFQHEKINIDLDLTRNMIQGLAVSFNGNLASMILNTATYYDHLEKKEPLQFAMFVTKPFDEVYTRLKSVLKPTFSFTSAATGSMLKYADFLECIRINLVCGNPLPNWISSFLDKDPETYESLSAMELYFSRFLFHCYVSGLPQEIPKDKGNLEDKLNKLEAIILKNYISKVFGNVQDKIDLLTPAQGQSLLLMADWLLKEFQMPVDSLYSALGCDIPCGDELPARETCHICKSEVKLESMKVGRCEKNHAFARCCHSLLLCDFVPYVKCISCKSVALQNVWNFVPLCTYCGLPMI